MFWRELQHLYVVVVLVQLCCCCIKDPDYSVEDVTVHLEYGGLSAVLIAHKRSFRDATDLQRSTPGLNGHNGVAAIDPSIGLPDARSAP